MVRSKRRDFFENIRTFEGLTIAEAAQKLGLSEGTLVSYLYETTVAGVKDGKIILKVDPEILVDEPRAVLGMGREVGEGAATMRRAQEEDYVMNAEHGTRTSMGTMSGSGLHATSALANWARRMRRRGEKEAERIIANEGKISGVRKG